MKGDFRYWLRGINARSCGDEPNGLGATMKPDDLAMTKSMLRAVVERRLSCRAVAREFNVHHSTVERRVKWLAAQAAGPQGIATIRVHRGS